MLVGVLLLLTGCTAAPKQTIELSEIVGEQLVEIQKSHEGFVQRYYAGLKKDVDNFMRDVWIPAFMAKLPENPQVKEDLAEADELMSIDTDAINARLTGVDEDTRIIIIQALDKAKAEGRADLVSVMIDVSVEAQRQIEIQRQAMINPIAEQEAKVLQQIRASYADTQRGHAAIQGYLASVVELKASQDEILKKMKLLDTRDKVLQDAASLSTKLSEALTKLPDESQGETADGLTKKVYDLLGISPTQGQ